MDLQIEEIIFNLKKNREARQICGVRVALVDQEASMLDLVRSGVGLSLVRDSIAITEAQARGLAVADRVSLECRRCFVSLRARRGEPVLASAWTAPGQVWR